MKKIISLLLCLFALSFCLKAEDNLTMEGTLGGKKIVMRIVMPYEHNGEIYHGWFYYKENKDNRYILTGKNVELDEDEDSVGIPLEMRVSKKSDGTIVGKIKGSLVCGHMSGFGETRIFEGTYTPQGGKELEVNVSNM